MGADKTKAATKTTKGTASTPTTRAGRAERSNPELTRGSYSYDGKKVSVLRTQDKHGLWADLFEITQSQIQILKGKTSAGEELDPKEMSKLDSCFNGIKKLIEIEGQLKSDAIASMPTSELMRFAKKAIKESTDEDKAKGIKRRSGRKTDAQREAEAKEFDRVKKLRSGGV